MILRSATPDDVEGILALWRRAEAEPSATDDRTSLLLLLETDPSALLVAEDDGHLVGTVMVTFDGWRANLYRLVVVPGRRRPRARRRG